MKGIGKRNREKWILKQERVKGRTEVKRGARQIQRSNKWDKRNDKGNTCKIDLQLLLYNTIGFDCSLY